ncbi:MAG: glycosyltransferase [Candidatus Binatia bacterium]|nr:glycosyltransferase [Candidatus Binatia bacterium]
MCEQCSTHLALFLPSLAGGGVARATLHLAEAFVRRGYRVDLVLCRKTGPYVGYIPSGVGVVTLSRGWQGRLWALSADYTACGALLLPILLPYKSQQTVPYLPALVRYLQRERPTALLAAKTPANLAALWARRLAGVPTRVVISERTTLSQEVRSTKKWRWRFISPVLRRVYPWADAIVAVSHGVADDLALVAHLPRDSIRTIYNPTVHPQITEKARAPLSHPWFAPGTPPVLLGVGRLEAQKDFPTLLRAFARVRAARPLRLLILGEGRKRRELETLAKTLGVAADVALPGFVDNPYAYMARAAVFVLSSAWEGLSNVLIEALACGCPVVSTDCPSGSAEVLAHGRYGPLVPVGDDAALARAIVAVLDTPPDRDTLRARAACFSVERAVEQYLEVLLPPGEQSARSGREEGAQSE